MKQKKSNRNSNKQDEEIKIQEILLTQIEEPEHAIREKIDPEGLKELAESIDEIGLIQPILLKQKKNGKYEIIAGHRRFLAHKMLKKKTIKAICLNKDKVESELIKFHENFFREDITPIQEAKWIKYMLDKLNITQKELAQKINKSTTYIIDRLKLLEMPKELQKAVDEKKISMSVALTLARVDDEREMKRLLNYAIDSGASVQTVEMWVHDYELSKIDDNYAREALEQHYQTIEQDSKLLFKCFACEQLYELNETIAVRLCNTCYNELKK